MKSLHILVASNLLLLPGAKFKELRVLFAFPQRLQMEELFRRSDALLMSQI